MGALRSPLPSKVDASRAIAVLESFGWEQRDGVGDWLCLTIRVASEATILLIAPVMTAMKHGDRVGGYSPESCSR